MGKPETESNRLDLPRVNTAQHEQYISEGAKSMVGGLLDLCAAQMNAAIERIKEAQKDPLSAERFIHNADKLLLMADQAYDLGEKARNNAIHLYTNPTKSFRGEDF